MRIFLAAVLFSVSLLIGSCDRGSHAEKGEYYLEQGEFKSAVIEFKKEIQKNPSSAPARLALARAYFQNGDITYAIQELKRSIEFDPSLTEARALLAKSYLAFGDIDNALKEAETYLQKSPQDADILIAKARALAALNRLAEARGIVDGVIAARVDFAPAYVALGQILYIQNDKPAAEKAFFKAVEIDPENADSQVALGDYYRTAALTDKSIAAYEKALEIQPKSLVALINLGGAYNAAKKPEKAIEIGLRVLKRFKGLPQGHYIVGGAYFIQGNIDLAVPELEKAGEVAPANYLLALAYAKKEQNTLTIEKAKKAISQDQKFVEPYVLLGRIYLQGGFTEDAVSILEKALALSASPNSDVLNLLGVAYARTQNVDKALQTFRESINAEPGQAQTYAYLASLYTSVGEQEKSLRVFEEFSTKFEDQEGADIPLILNYIKIGRIEQAIELCNKNLAKDPKNYLYTNLLGVAYLKKGDLAAAKATFSKAVEIDPKKTDAYLNLAHIAKIEGNNDEIIALCQKTLEKDPKNVVALRALIEANIAKGGREQAIAKLEEMISEKPKDLMLNVAAGELYLSANNPQKAEEYAKRAIEIDPANGGGHAILGLSYFSQGGKIEQAEASLKRATELTPDNFLFRFRLGQALAAGNKPDAAVAEFKRTLELNPSFVQAELALSQLYTTSQKYYDAIDLLTKVKTKSPDNTLVDFMLGVAYQGAGDNKNAALTYREYLKIKPQDAAALNNMAWVLGQSGQHEEALSFATKALAIVPNNALVIDTMGWVLYLSGKRQEALSHLEKAASLLPDQPTIRYHLGTAHFSLGNRDKAKRELEQALQISPSFPEAADARKLLDQFN
ncbi:MAG: tetratricopeptide repeat protein [Deltaproteobacteria bacterium]